MAMFRIKIFNDLYMCCCWIQIFNIYWFRLGEIFHLFCLSKPVESKVMESLNTDILLLAILTSSVVCVSMRDWTSSVVGRTSSWGRRKQVVTNICSFKRCHHFSQTNSKHLLIDVVCRKVDIDGILVIHKSANACHWCIQQAFLFI